MVNNEIISLDTKIWPVIKDIADVKNQNNLTKIKQWNIRHMLTHTAGYQSQMASARFIKNINENDIVNYVLNYDIPFEVGKRYAYNNAEPFLLSVFFYEAFNINILLKVS
jgi:CubicO group peptidase (beta-lactamase class C family)